MEIAQNIQIAVQASPTAKHAVRKQLGQGLMGEWCY
jgi:hypothetical protein